METKKLKINIPEGYEIDKENSTFECIKFKKKDLTYEDIAISLFNNKKTYFIDEYGEIKSVELEGTATIDYTNCTSEKQAEKLLAINQLMNVAKYLNGSWKPNWTNDKECKYYICINSDQVIDIWHTDVIISNNIYFKSHKLAEQAIKILGEDTIRLALSTDW